MRRFNKDTLLRAYFGWFAIAAAMAMASCGAPPTESDCSNAIPVRGTVTILGIETDLVRTDLLVRGTAEHPGGLAIRNIDVSGVQADNLDFNFNQWEALVAFDRLLALDAELTGTVVLEVTSRDSCNVRTQLGVFQVDIDPDPALFVERLGLEVTLPTVASYLPATGNLSALVTVTANPEAAGAVVVLDTSLGTFDSGNDLVLLGAGNADAAATTFLSSAEPGVALVTATGETQLDQASVVFAGAPTLIPGGGSVATGQTIRVTVFTDGVIETCQATPATGAMVVSGGQNLTASPGGTDDTGDGRIDIDITATEDLVEDGEVTVVCADVFGQAGTGTYQLVANDP
jgi:hypothetical protein